MTTEQDNNEGKELRPWRMFFRGYLLTALSIVPLLVVAYFVAYVIARPDQLWIATVITIAGLIPYLVEWWRRVQRNKIIDAYIDLLWKHNEIVEQQNEKMSNVIDEALERGEIVQGFFDTIEAYLDREEASNTEIRQLLDRADKQNPSDQNPPTISGLRNELAEQKNAEAGRKKIDLDPELLDRIQAMLDARQTSLRKEAERQHTSRQTLSRRLEERKKEKEGGP